MIMALCAFQRDAEYAFAECIRPIADIGRSVFFVDDASFLGYWMISVECLWRGWTPGGIRQQVAGKLVGEKLIVRYSFR